MASKWIHCPVCDHRMFLNRGEKFDIEIKCPSCKRIIRFTDTERKEVKQDVQKQPV